MSYIFRSLLILTSFMVSLPILSKGSDIPLLDSAPYDTIIDGKPVSLFTIKRGKVAAQILNYGGFVVSLYSPDRDGEYSNLVTHYSDIHQYMNYNMGQIGPALGRYANRIANAKFQLDGKEYNITRNSGQHTLHGGNAGFDHTIWSVEKHTKNSLVLSCTLADGEDGFPGALTTILTYTITRDGGLEISYSATTDKATVVNLSNHTYFNLDGVDKGSNIYNHYLTVNAHYITETDRGNIPTGALIDVTGTPYDFRTSTNIGERTYIPQGGGFGFGQPIPNGKVRNFDNNFCLYQYDGKRVKRIAELYSPQSGRVLEVLSNHPGLQVYTGSRVAIALESQMYPDSPNHINFPSTTLRPGERYKHTCIYRLSTR